MSGSLHSPEGIEVKSAVPPRHLVIEEMESILASALFRTSRQCQRLLRHIVERTLDGHGEVLRERMIGMEVFDRPADYDPGQDPVVRIRAADVRKRLAQYYQANNGEREVVIDVPSGSYRATFRVHSISPGVQVENADGETVIVGATAVETLPVVQAASTDQSRRWVVFAAIGLIIAVMAVSLALISLRSRGTDKATGFDQFWAPFFSSAQPVLLCMGSNAVYTLSESYMAAYRLAHNIAADGAETFAVLPPKGQIPSDALVPVPNTFVGNADVIAATDVVALLATRRKSYAERFSGDMSFIDLRNTPAVLIGGFNNRWTLEMTGDLRFRMADGHSIVDTQTSRIWSTAGIRQDHPTDDYALISRLVDGKTGAPLLVIAGIGTYGTQAAGEFVSSRAALEGLVRNAPKGWAQKNMQIVLHVKVVDFAPSTTDIIAQRFW